MPTPSPKRSRISRNRLFDGGFTTKAEKPLKSPLNGFERVFVIGGWKSDTSAKEMPTPTPTAK